MDLLPAFCDSTWERWFDSSPTDDFGALGLGFASLNRNVDFADESDETEEPSCWASYTFANL
jgi:hypothetical protein